MLNSDAKTEYTCKYNFLHRTFFPIAPASEFYCEQVTDLYPELADESLSGGWAPPGHLWRYVLRAQPGQRRVMVAGVSPAHLNTPYILHSHTIAMENYVCICTIVVYRMEIFIRFLDTGNLY